MKSSLVSFYIKSAALFSNTILIISKPNSLELDYAAFSQIIQSDLNISTVNVSI